MVAQNCVECDFMTPVILKEGLAAVFVGFFQGGGKKHGKKRKKPFLGKIGFGQVFNQEWAGDYDGT